MKTALEHHLSVEEARAKLGLSPKDRIADALPAWEAARQRLLDLEAAEIDWMQKTRYRKELNALDEALEVLLVEMESSQKRGPLLWLLSVLVLGGLCGWAYVSFPYQEEVAPAPLVVEEVKDVESLVAESQQAIEKRRWDEAESLLAEIAEVAPEHPWLSEGRGRLTEGIAEERGQQIGFLVGNIQSALEVVNLGEAESLIAQLEEMDPSNERLPEFRQFLKEARVEVRSMVIVKSVKAAMEEEQWEEASKRLTDLEKFNPEHPEVLRLVAELERVRREREEKEMRAMALYAQAREIDEGEFSAEALELLQEAMTLSKLPEIKNLYEKMSAYGRIIQVPADYDTIQQAIEAAKANDRIRLAPGEYEEALVLSKSVELEGTKAEDTIIHCPAEQSSVVSLGKEVKAIIRGVTLRQSGFAHGSERRPVVLVLGGQELDLFDCRIENGSGHGVAVLDGGRAVLRACRVTSCGWDGVSVVGEGSIAQVENSRLSENLHHGVDFWDGGAGLVVDCVLSGNGRSGFVALQAGAGLEVRECEILDNREVGLLVSASHAAKIGGNLIKENLLGGIVIEKEAKVDELSGNEVTANGEAGLVVERASSVTSLTQNKVNRNKGRQEWLEAVFPEVQEEEISDIPAAPKAAAEEPVDSTAKAVLEGE
ncbi:MAG: right-handed parallel beta-helix repeat-containing protein [Verrucomicrobiales bacterium]